MDMASGEAILLSEQYSRFNSLTRGFHPNAAWLTGTRIAFAVGFGEHGGIMVTDADGSEQHLLLDLNPGEWATDLRASADGSSLYWRRVRPRWNQVYADYGLRWIDIETGQEHILSAVDGAAPFRFGTLDRAGITNAFIYAPRAGEFEIRIHTLDELDVQQVITLPLTSPGDLDDPLLVWSPDGTQLALHLEASGDLLIVDRLTEDVRSFNADTFDVIAQVETIAWSPMGNGLALDGGIRDAGVIMDLSTGRADVVRVDVSFPLPEEVPWFSELRWLPQ